MRGFDFGYVLVAPHFGYDLDIYIYTFWLRFGCVLVAQFETRTTIRINTRTNIRINIVISRTAVVQSDHIQSGGFLSVSPSFLAAPEPPETRREGEKGN